MFARIGRVVSSVTVWILMVLGVVSVAMWVLSTAGLVQPLVVVSGSMSPAIQTGDLLISVATDVDDLSVGDVATIRSTITGNLVTHRIVEITDADGVMVIRMQGDANNAIDGEDYLVPAGDRVWRPLVTIPGGGHVVVTMTQPAVAVPLVAGILALSALSMVPSSHRRPTEAADDDAAVDPAAAITPESRNEAREEVSA